MKPTLLIVDDDQGIRTQMKWALDPDYEIVSAEDRPGAIESFKAAHPAVTLLDLGLPPRPNESEEGLAALADLLAIDRAAKIIVISGQSEKKNAIQAVGAGAYDFLCKPIDVDELKLLLRRCVYVSDLEKGYREMQQKLRADICENTVHLSRSIATRFQRTCWRASCSAMKRVRLPALTYSAKASSKIPPKAHYFWMRSVNCRRRSKSSSCAFFRTSGFNVSAADRRSRLTHVLLPQRMLT